MSVVSCRYGKRWLELTERSSMAGTQARAFCAMHKVTAPSSSRLHLSCGQPLFRILCIVRLWNTKLTLRVLACSFIPMFGVSSLLCRWIICSLRNSQGVTYFVNCYMCQFRRLCTVNQLIVNSDERAYRSMISWIWFRCFEIMQCTCNQ